ncbi:hypothetical protein [Streptomyces megasporus]|uniref:hypothetical protein n=1 Tax=Streptomyces megasporus TaxID=44060 RepID=UPI0004E1F349|nr:hypothetical protein [Streptomyces megasporus]
MTPTAMRLHAGPATATVTGPPAVVDWVSRYVTPWWHTTKVTPGATGSDGEPRIEAAVDPDRYTEAAGRLAATRNEEVSYARSPMLLTRHTDGTTLAVSPAQQLSYRSDPATGRLDIVGAGEETVATATARLAREAVRGVLLRSGWVILHASAAVHGNRAALAFGGKGAGKTTLAFTLARTGNWSLLANDRVFARVEKNGRVRVLPWPAAAAVGLGLLDALGWYETVRGRLAAGERLHPTVDPRVTAALAAGRREPLWEGRRELKAQVWPHQLADWFGLDLIDGAEATALLFPTFTSDAAPARIAGGRELGESDFMAGVTEDRYPDVLDLVRVPIGGAARARTAVTETLHRLPRHEVTLTHNTTATAKMLADLTL